MPILPSNIKHGVNSFPGERVSKITAGDLSDTRFQQIGKKWIDSLPRHNREAGQKVLQRIEYAISSKSERINLSDLQTPSLPEELIIQNLSTLQSADFSNHKISAHFISKLTKLKELSANNCQLRNFEKINLPQLTTLSLAENKLTEYVIKNCNFPKTTKVNLENNQLVSLQSIREMFPKVFNLRIGNNRITHSEGIRALVARKLKFIDLSDNPLTQETRACLLTSRLSKNCIIKLGLKDGCINTPQLVQHFSMEPSDWEGVMSRRGPLDCLLNAGAAVADLLATPQGWINRVSATSY